MFNPMCFSLQVFMWFYASFFWHMVCVLCFIIHFGLKFMLIIISEFYFESSKVI